MVQPVSFPGCEEMGDPLFDSLRQPLPGLLRGNHVGER